MRASQEPDEHQQQKYRVGRRNSDSASRETVRVQGEACLENRVILRSNLSFQARGRSADYSSSETPHQPPIELTKGLDVRCESCDTSGEEYAPRIVSPKAVDQIETAINDTSLLRSQIAILEEGINF
jgi:hypothetical protein